MTMDPELAPYIAAIVVTMIIARVIWINGAWIVAGIVYGIWTYGIGILIIPFAIVLDILFAIIYALTGQWDDYESMIIGTWNDISTKHGK